jgi:SNF2 family DNA or RNA helicase
LALEQIENHEKQGKCLIVVSKTLIESWRNEIAKFFGDTVKYEVFHQTFMKKETDSYVPASETKIIITTPEMLTKAYIHWNIEEKFVDIETEYIGNLQHKIKMYNHVCAPFVTHTTTGGFLYSTDWGCVVVDEIQTYTNISSKRCLAIASLYSMHKWGLSGTILNEPTVERLLGYYLIIGDTTFPRCLPDANRFVKSSAYTGYLSTMVARSSNEEFVKPGVHERIIVHELCKEEYAIYLSLKRVINSIQNKLVEFKLNRNVEMIRTFNSYLLVMICYLRQFIVCPLVPYASMALDLTNLTTLKNEMIQIFKHEIQALGIDDYLASEHSAQSSRVKEVVKVVNEHNDELVIVFTCFRTNLNVINEYLPKDRPHFTIASKHTPQQRAEVLQDFERSKSGILMLTYDLGAEGLNLQFCSTVLLTDFWWNSGKTQQAIARVLRYGQKANVVNVYFFTSNTGIEKAIFTKNDEKLEILKELASGPIKSKIAPLNMNAIMAFINQNDNVDLIKKIQKQ